MDAGREDRTRLAATVALVVVAAVVVASGGGAWSGPEPDEPRELQIVRSTEELVDVGRPFAVVGDRLVSLACGERCHLLVGASQGEGAGDAGVRTIMLPPGRTEWRDELLPVPSPDGRRLAFTLIQDGIPRTAVADLRTGTLLVRSTSFLDEDRLDELRWEGEWGVVIPRLIGGDLLWTVAAPSTADPSG